jgi:1,2-phenylacetyl-CoA epoxidase catalytic subunit
MTALHVSCNAAVQLTDEECRTIAPCIQQFQLGEGSRGQRLFERGQKYGQAVNDPIFAEALDIFIREEQQHSRYLAAFMESQFIPCVQKHWVDTVFRKLRGLAGLEMSLTVLVTAEMISVPYYRALRGATGSAILRMICNRILDDEANHLRFQASMLARVASARAPALRRALGQLHRFFLLGTILVVWTEHRSVFEAAGYTFQRFRNETLVEFSDWNTAREAWLDPAASRERHSPEWRRRDRQSGDWRSGVSGNVTKLDRR